MGRRIEAKRLPRYVQAVEVGGHRYLYFRYKGRRQRLPDDPTTAVFHTRYAELLAGTELPPTAERIKTGSLRALIRDYLASREFHGLSGTSQEYYRRQLDRLSCVAEYSASAIQRGHLMALRDKIVGRRSADQFIQVVRRLFSWALTRDLVSVNPATGIPRLHKSERYLAWPEEAFARFEATTPRGPLFKAYMLGRYTGQRRGDVLTMTLADYDGAWVRVEAQEKTGETLWIPAHPKLAAHLDSLEIDIGLLAPGPHGGTWDRSAFAKAFRRALDAAGLDGLHFHGLRHAASRELAEAGCSDEEIAAITGHRSRAMTAHYTRQARQRTLAKSAITRLIEHQQRTGTEQEGGKSPVANGKKSS